MIFQIFKENRFFVTSFARIWQILHYAFTHQGLYYWTKWNDHLWKTNCPKAINWDSCGLFSFLRDLYCFLWNKQAGERLRRLCAIRFSNSFHAMWGLRRFVLPVFFSLTEAAVLLSKWMCVLLYKEKRVRNLESFSFISFAWIITKNKEVRK